MHAPDYLRYLDETADQLCSDTRARMTTEYEVITEGFKLLNSTFHALAGFSETDSCSDDLLKSARTTLALRMTNCLQAALILAERDLALESLSLCRDALEAAYMWKYLEIKPSAVSNWFDSGTSESRGTGFAGVLRQTGDYDAVYPTYRFLCKFCHPSGMTFYFEITVNPSDYLFSRRQLCFAMILFVAERFINEVTDLFANRFFREDAPCRKWAEKAKAMRRRLYEQFQKNFCGALARAAQGVTN